MSSSTFSITDPIGSGVARTWFGFRYPDQDQDSKYYSFNVMHVYSHLLADHALLTQLHGSFLPAHGMWKYDVNKEFKESKTNFYSRSRNDKGKRSTFRVVP